MSVENSVNHHNSNTFKKNMGVVCVTEKVNTYRDVLYYQVKYTLPNNS